jgi:predicted dehydrogenase
MNRREFIASTAATTVAFSAKSYAQIIGANSKVGLGVVGIGRRGRIVGAAFQQDARTRLVAIADTYEATRLRLLAQMAPELPVPASYNAHEDLLANKDVDAVLLATPDHLHVSLAKAAIGAGKHVYLEKPTLHRWRERETLVTAAASSKRVLQCGMQQRSGAVYQRAKQEYLDTGKLGQIVLVRAVWHDFSWQRREIVDAPKPAGLDWERFLGPAPHVPYQTARYDSWRYFHDYGNGLLADILTHWVDVAQWFLNDSEPQSAYATGGIFQLNDGRDNPDTVSAVIAYKKWNLNFESSVLSIRNDRPSVVFEGTEGVLEIARDGYIYTPRQGEVVRVDTRESLEKSHTKNFLDAVTNGATPNAPLEAGIAASVPVLLSLKSYWQHGVQTKLDETD